MRYDFDEIVDRRGTNSLKYDFAEARGMPPDLLPLWVADMDFRAPPPVLDALTAAVQHGIFGYSDSQASYSDAVRQWFAERFAYAVRDEWIVKTPGVVFALATAVRAFTDENDAVLIQPPVYYPFSAVVKANNRRLAVSELRYENSQYQMDFADFTRKIREQRVKLFLLCNPHNPVGRVWTRDELLTIGEICARENVIVIADEIHADFVWGENQHRIFSTIKPDFGDFSVICTAPSKTFNLAGLQVSNIFIANEKLRKKFRHALAVSGYSQLNALGLVACESAYRHGGEWLAQLKIYLENNAKLMRDFLRENLPSATMPPLEGTYLAWVDCRGLGFSAAELNSRIINHAKLWLDDGAIFGDSGRGFQRFNLACPRDILRAALTRFAAAMQD